MGFDEYMNIVMDKAEEVYVRRSGALGYGCVVDVVVFGSIWANN